MRLAFVALTLLLTACSGIALTPHKIEIRQGNWVTPEMRERLQIGMTRLQVQAVLGTPMISDPFHAARWDYAYRLEQEGELKEKSRLTVYFDGESLVKIDDSAAASGAPVAEAK